MTTPCGHLPEGHPDHEYRWIEDEYGSLAEGGSYEIYECRKCGQKHYCQMPD